MWMCFLMIRISFFEFVTAIIIIWAAVRLIVFAKTKQFDIKYELKLLPVCIYLIVVARFVYFPYRLIDGHIGNLNFDASKILPFNVNLVPSIHMVQWVPKWARFNYFGNIFLFIPVGIIFPNCLKKLDSIKTNVLIGFIMSVIIELSQLLLFERFTDIDDVITNTFGVLIGSCIYFFFLKKIIEKIKQKNKEKN